jgi:thiamine pyrophosphokinase
MSHSSAFLLPSPSAAAAGADADGAAYALLVLNQRLPRFAPRLWDRAQVRVCADGGANRVFDGMPELFPGQDPDEVRRRYKPDVIKGDLDSVRPEVKEYYSNMGTQIVDESHDQDTTDLHKCVAFITENSAIPNKSNVNFLSSITWCHYPPSSQNLLPYLSFNCSCVSLLLGPLGEGLTTRWETSTYFISSQTTGSYSYRMIA